MPHLSDLWSEVSQARADVEFLAVGYKDTAPVVRAWWKENGYKLRPVMQNKCDVSAAFGVQAFPTNYVIGPDGKVIWAGAGPDRAMIRGALASTLKRDEPGD